VQSQTSFLLNNSAKYQIDNGQQPKLTDESDPHWLRVLCWILAVSYLPLSFLHGSLAGAVLHVLALLGLFRLILFSCVPGKRQKIVIFWRKYGLFCVGMMAPMLAGLISQLADGRFVWSDISVTQERLALSGLVLFALVSVPVNWLRHIQWGILMGVLIAVGTLLIDSRLGEVRPEPVVLNLLNFSNILVLLGIFCLCTFGWQLTSGPRTEKGIKVVGFLLMLLGLVVSQSRGPLLSFVVLMAFYLLFFVSVLALRWRVLGLMVFVGVLVFAVFSSDDFRKRLDDGVTTTLESVDAALEGREFSSGEGSLRIRFGLWRASWDMFVQSPWTGDSRQKFSERLVLLNQAGMVNDLTTWKIEGPNNNKRPYTQPHNEVANELATRGVVGLISLLWIYFVPLFYFIKSKRDCHNITAWVPVQMGLLISIGTILFGLTVSVFTSSFMTSFWVLTVAVMLALSRQEDANIHLEKP